MNMLCFCQARILRIQRVIENASFFNIVCPLSVQALKSISCLSYLSYAATTG
jgi:hypothetical protein